MRERNCSIDIFRYAAALLIVALHTTPLIDIHPMVSYLFAQVLPRVGVPFFFIVAGYFYMTKLENGTADPAKYVRRLLLPYVVWSVIYFAAYFVQHGGISLEYIVSKFFLYGSSYHFWFFPSIIFCVIVATLAYRCHVQFLLIPTTVLLYLVGCAGHAYYAIFEDVPLISALMGSEKYLWYTHFLCCGPAFFSQDMCCARPCTIGSMSGRSGSACV